jgi:hypothetical protein
MPALAAIRDRAKINSVIMAQEFCPLARRERRAYPAPDHVGIRSEQRSQRAKGQARIAEVIFALSLNGAPGARFREPQQSPNFNLAVRAGRMNHLTWPTTQFVEFPAPPLSVGQVNPEFDLGLPKAVGWTMVRVLSRRVRLEERK